MSVRLMLPGEIALVTCPPDYAYDKFPRLLMKNLGFLKYLSAGNPHLNIYIYILASTVILFYDASLHYWHVPFFFIRPLNVPEGAHIQWEIELLAFETPKVLWKFFS